ncbi:dicarboxylate/amino acid:cation symporter [Cetobacterium sp. 2G large]|uniref:dicarboxylate/amino acid:cation symporter n=2 Tax=Cetobacterium TaxID=180162 RepID=UPI00163BCBB8|nr:dicarboxylate/amino acid:cation symporter [Cetobacterium sp. 2G large]MBC2853481.1 dicarboxylate/amino acid:cation symporter [Cetobacterium sp. 2G large]
MERSKFWGNYGSSILLLLGIIVGSIVGVVLGEKAMILSPIGDIFLNLMFTIVVPMVFISISTAVGNMLNMKRLGKILGSLMAIFIGTGIVAAILIFVVVNIFPPAVGAKIVLNSGNMGTPSSAANLIVNSLTVNDFSGLFSRKNMLPIIIASIGFGFSVSVCGGEESPVGKLLNNMNNIIMKLVELIMKLAPVGLGAYFASLIGEFGPKLLGDYGRAMLIYYPTCILYAVLAFPLYAYISGGKEGVSRMSKYILTPALTAFATQSSVATLPTNMAACKNIGVPKDVYEIVLPMGATMHMDGSVISSILKISFLFGIFDLEFAGIDTYLMALVVSILSAFVLSGAPGGGLVGEMLIVSLFGFPPEAFPIVATLGFLVDPMATCLNAAGDTIASMMVSRVVEGEKWIEENKEEVLTV